MQKKIVDQLVEGINKRDIACLARAITLVESEKSNDQILAHELIAKFEGQSRQTIRIGVSGIPGGGKSTLIDALGIHLVNAGHQVAVLAIDPSSEKTGGSILGDKTRMTRLSVHPNAFIRPSPNRGVLGGVGARSREAILLCEAAGYDIVIVETVGVGQSETIIAQLVDLVLLVAVAGVGDEIQGIKKGILEIAHLVVVNKSDNGNETKVNIARQELEMAFKLYAQAERPEVVGCSALENKNIDLIWQKIAALDKNLGPIKAQQRNQQNLFWMWAVLKEKLLSEFKNSPGLGEQIAIFESKVQAGAISPSSAAQDLIKIFLGRKK